MGGATRCHQRLIMEERLGRTYKTIIIIIINIIIIAIIIIMISIKINIARLSVGNLVLSGNVESFSPSAISM